MCTHTYVCTFTQLACTQHGCMYHSEDQAPACIRAFGMHPCSVLASCVNTQCVCAPLCACVSQHIPRTCTRTRHHAYTLYRTGIMEGAETKRARTWSAHRRGVRCMCVHEHAHAHCWYLTMCSVSTSACVHVRACACVCICIYIYIYACVHVQSPASQGAHDVRTDA